MPYGTVADAECTTEPLRLIVMRTLERLDTEKRTYWGFFSTRRVVTRSSRGDSLP